MRRVIKGKGWGLAYWVPAPGTDALCPLSDQHRSTRPRENSGTSVEGIIPGFDFRYTLSGASPTVRSLPIKDLQQLTRGDLLNLEAGQLDLGARGDRALIGVALESKIGAEAATYVDVIIDADAVYSVVDGESRRRGDALDLTGVTGGQSVVTSAGGALVVVVSSTAAEPTLVRIAAGSHGSPRARADGAARLNRAVARAVAGISSRYLGHGPKRTEAFFHRNVMVVLLEDPLTTAERSLAAQGSMDTVARMRDAFQRGMTDELKSAIAELTGANVVGFISGSNFDPDIAAEVFLLDRPIRPD
jgi:uncharacterized protein YbcI